MSTIIFRKSESFFGGRFRTGKSRPWGNGRLTLYTAEGIGGLPYIVCDYACGGMVSKPVCNSSSVGTWFCMVPL